MKLIQLATAKKRIKNNQPVYCVFANGEARKVSYFTKDGFASVYQIESWSTTWGNPVCYRSFVPVHSVEFASSI